MICSLTAKQHFFGFRICRNFLAAQTSCVSNIGSPPLHPSHPFSTKRHPATTPSISLPVNRHSKDLTNLSFRTENLVAQFGILFTLTVSEKATSNIRNGGSSRHK